MTRLRTGFTTGAYAAATALAAWRCVCGRRNGRRIGLRFPDGKLRRVNLDGWTRGAHEAHAWATKDAGDDIDITQGAVVRARLGPAAGARERAADYVVACGRATLILRGGPGIGRATRPGLDVPVGKWAITPVPRRMIAQNLSAGGFGDSTGIWQLEIAIDRGAMLARKTLNPTLGIVGGLSVLGTSGIVVPCSNAAYIRTIEVLLQGARRLGCTTAVLVTGGRTHRAARAAYPELPDVAFVRIGDFIGEACAFVAADGYDRVVVCCMPGKLAKYALGHDYTHAHHVAQSIAPVLALLQADRVAAADDLTPLQTCRSIRECLARMPAPMRTRTLAALRDRARQAIRAWTPGVEVDVRVIAFDNDQGLM